MTGVTSPLAIVIAVVTVLAMGAGAAGWWHYRRRLAQLRGRLQESEDSRLQLFEHATELQERLDAADQARRASPRPARDTGDTAQRIEELERLLAETTPTKPAEWQDTLPASQYQDTVIFAPTEPADLQNQR
jgi:uncharacterized protein HemX